MIKNYMEVKQQREAWVKEDTLTDHATEAAALKTKLFKTLDRVGISLQSKRVVQFGCKKGYLFEGLSERALYIHAVDFSSTMLKISHRHLAPTRDGVTNYLVSPIIRDFSVISDLSTDFVIDLELLKHLPEPMAERVIEDARRLIMPKGYLVFSLPLAEKHHTKVDFHNPNFDTVYWTKEELKNLADKYNYNIVQIDTISIFQRK